jgi:hypothetical protein
MRSPIHVEQTMIERRHLRACLAKGLSNGFRWFDVRGE